MEDQSRQHLTSWSCLGLSKQFLSGERIQASLSMYETSSMCREVMRTANTFPPPPLAQPRSPSSTCRLSFEFPSCSELLLASRKQRLGFESGVSTSFSFFAVTGAQKPFGTLCLLTSEHLPWQRAPGLAEPSMRSPMLLLVKAPYEAPLSVP